MLCILSVIFTMVMSLLFIKKNFKNVSLNTATFILGGLTAIYIVLTNSNLKNVGKILCLDELEHIYIKHPRISGWHISHFSLFFFIVRPPLVVCFLRGARDQGRHPGLAVCRCSRLY